MNSKMSTELHKLSPANIMYKFPTIKAFEKSIISSESTKVFVNDKHSNRPKLPSYLKEMSSRINPYTEIKINRTGKLKELEKCRKNFNIDMYKAFPIEKSVNRNTRIGFNAGHTLRNLKYSIDCEEQPGNGKKMNLRKIEVKLPKSLSVSNTDFLIDKRRVCLLELETNFKEEQFEKLDEIVRCEEEYIKKENERIDRENFIYERCLRSVCQNTSDAIVLAEKEVGKRGKYIRKVNRAIFVMAHLNSDYIQLEEEYLKLKTYKDFLKNCHKQLLRKQAIERTSLMNELKMDKLLNKVEQERRAFSDMSDKDEMSEMKMIKFVNDTRKKSEAIRGTLRNNQNAQEFSNGLLNANNKCFSNTEESEYGTFNKEQLEKLKALILLGFNNSKQESFSEISELFQTVPNSEPSEEYRLLDERDLIDNDLLFDTPYHLLNVLGELEANNLSLIENVQEQEEMCDLLKLRIGNIKHDMKTEITIINKHILATKQGIISMEDSIKCIQEIEKFLHTFSDLEGYKTFFNFGDIQIDKIDEMMNYLDEQITVLYYSVFEKIDSGKNNKIDMLKKLEILINALYVEIISHDKKDIIKVKKEVDERKRNAARLRQKQHCADLKEMKLQKAIANAMKGPSYKFGRKVVYRSEPHNEVLKTKQAALEIVRDKEETEYFFIQE